MNHFSDQLEAIMPTGLTGSIVRTEGLIASVAGFPAPVGGVARIERQAGAAIEAEVIGFREGMTLVLTHGFRKKSDETPRKHISLVEQRRDEYLTQRSK